MQKTFTLVILLLSFYCSFSQLTTYRINNFQPPAETEIFKTIMVEMPFGKSSVSSVTGDTVSFQAAGDIEIDIVCTDFPASNSLKILNEQRLITLYKRFPFIKEKNIGDIKIIRQTDGAEKIAAEKMFHGLVIRFRPAQTTETIDHDLARLEEMLQPENPVRMMPHERDSSRRDTIIKEKTTPFFTPVSRKEERKMAKKDRLEHSIASGVKIDWFIQYGHDTASHLILTPKEALRLNYITRKDYRNDWKHNEKITIMECSGKCKAALAWLKTRDSLAIIVHPVDVAKYYLPDSTVIKTLRRNRWRKMAVVGDVTGSMYPYTAQLLLWLKLESLDSLTSYYTFFNDGDNTPDRQKLLGETGGIYSKQCASFSEVANLVKKTMKKGAGGDSPENNIEAILQSEKEFPEADFHVMIADNWAPVKDVKLARKITKPVRIVLCGVYDDHINTQYLDLARLTGGSVHLVEQDLFNLASRHEGESIQVGNKTFKIVDGHFKLVVEMETPVL